VCVCVCVCSILVHLSKMTVTGQSSRSRRNFKC